jgi:hypothetical protein
MLLLSRLQRPVTLAFLIGIVVLTRTASGQVIAPAGVRNSFPVTPGEPCAACSKRAIVDGHQREAAFGLGHSRKIDAFVGFVAGGVVGFGIGALKAHHDLRRCGEACEAPFAGVNEMLGGIVIGAALGTAVGAFWPVRQ